MSGIINGFYRPKPRMYPKEMQQAASLSEKTTPFFFMQVSDPKSFLQEGSWRRWVAEWSCHGLRLANSPFPAAFVICHRHLSNCSLLSFPSYRMLLPCKHSISPRSSFQCLLLVTLVPSLWQVKVALDVLCSSACILLHHFSRCAWLMDYLPFAAWLLFFCL